MCCDKCSEGQRKLSVFGIGSALVLFGLVLVLCWSDISINILQKSLRIANGSENYNNWKITPIPIYARFTLFNWTNPDEIRNPHKKPNFVEMGPYVFREIDYKEDIEFHNNATVSYFNKRVWHFVPELSNGTLDDIVTTAHVITASVADATRNNGLMLKKTLNFLLNHEGGCLVTSHKAGDWIFAGYEDKLIDFLRLFNGTFHIPYKKFGWLVDRNDSKTYDGRFMMQTGTDDIFKLGQLTHWNHNPTNGFYPGLCGKVNGSAGDLFPPSLDTTQDITIYVTDTCRYLNLSPRRSAYVNGIRGFEWVGTVNTFDSGENNPDEQCFCNPLEHECPKTGVVECRKCRNNAPIYASFPHFYLADPSYVNAVSGISPTEEKHQFRIVIEPATGVPLEVNARLQINLLLQPDHDYDIYRGVPKVLLPMFYFEEIAHLNGDILSKTKLGVRLTVSGLYVGYTLISVGLFMVVVGIVLTVTKRWSRETADDLEPLTN